MATFLFLENKTLCVLGHRIPNRRGAFGVGRLLLLPKIPKNPNKTDKKILFVEERIFLYEFVT